MPVQGESTQGMIQVGQDYYTNTIAVKIPSTIYMLYLVYVCSIALQHQSHSNFFSNLRSFACVLLLLT